MSQALAPQPGDKVKTDWAAVYRATYPELVRYLLWSVRDEDKARDLAQEAFARVLDRDPDNARALVFTVASNLAKDEARTVVRRKRHLALLKVEADVTQETRVSPVEHTARNEQVERLRKALETLSDRDREVLLLWDAGLSYVEMAAQTGLAKTALGTTIARAKRKLVEAHEALEADDAALG